MKRYFDVELYYNHKASDTVSFSHRWQALLFHWLANKSIFHNASRHNY